MLQYTMRFTVLVENESRRPELSAEHGISLWVQTAEANVLFDTGASSAFADNADRLGISIDQADFLVLSHAHADHTGGLRTFFDRNFHAPVFVGPGITTERFSVRDSGTRAIGMDRELYERHRNRFYEVSNTLRPIDGVGLSRVQHRPHPVPAGNKSLLREYEGGTDTDPFEEELFMWVEESDGIRVVTGCSHSGIVNIVEAAAAYGTLVSVVGGFHLNGEAPQDVRRIAHLLSSVANAPRAHESDVSTSVPAVYTGHCTGREAFGILKEELGSRVYYAATGLAAEA